jgi:AAA+ superfamily predicted ATPase
MLDEKKKTKGASSRSVVAIGAGDLPTVNWDKLNPDIKHVGPHITLPADPEKMGLDSAIEHLERKREEENEEIHIFELIDAFPDDAFVAVNRALAEIYGWASPKPTPGFFGPQPPVMRTVKTGPEDHDKISVPVGAFAIPGVKAHVHVEGTRGPNGPVAVVHGTFPRKQTHHVMDIVTVARKILRQQSIYKGKAIQVNPNEENNFQITSDNAPTFLGGIPEMNIDDLILNAGEADQIRTNLWAPIEKTENCRKHKVPLKRGVLLEGRYGIGKTMTARATAKKCVENGWTFIMLSDVRGLKAALEFARRYQPAVVFAEDIDRVIAERDDRGNDLINTIDGVVNSRDEVITVLTTNFVEKLDRSMLRPGRLDSVIRIKTPDAVSCERLIRTYARDTLPEDESVEEACTRLSQTNAIPATVREVVERAKLAMLADGRDTINAKDLEISANSMAEHMELMQETVPEVSVEQKFGEAFLACVDKGLIKGLEKIDTRVEEIHDCVV